MTEATDLTFAARRSGDVRLVAAVSAAHFVSHFYMLVLPPLFDFVRADYGLSYTEVGLALTVFMAVSAVLQTPAGFLVDRFNARHILIAGLLCGAAGLVLAASFHSYWMLVAMFGLMGLGNTVYHPANYALLSRHVAPGRISQAFSVHTFSGLLGGAVAPASLLFLHGLLGWRGAFVGAALLGCTAAMALLTLNEATMPVAAKPAGSGAAPETGWRLLLTPPILISFVFFGLMAFCSFGFMNFAVVALGALHGTDATTANAALTGYLLLSAFGVLAGGFVSARVPNHRLTATLALLATAFTAAAIGSLPMGSIALVATSSLAGLFFGAMLPARDMILREVTPEGAFGKVFGFVTNGFNIGGILAPLIYGGLMDHGAPRMVFYVIALSALVCIASIAAVPRTRPGA